MVTGDISSILSSMNTGSLQEVQGVRPPPPGGRPGNMVEKIESQLESEGIETLDSGKSVSEFMGELKAAIEETESGFGVDTDPREIGDAVREAVSNLMKENGLDPEDFRPERPAGGMQMAQGEQEDSTGMMSQIGQQLAALFGNQATDTSTQLLQAINQIPAGSGVDLVA